MPIPSDAFLLDRKTILALASCSPRVRQILHAIQAEVVRQRYSAVLLPDTAIAEIVWGGASRWPKRWRRDLRILVSKLPPEFVEHADWRPVWSREERGRKVIRRRQNVCPNRCPLHGSDVPHRHLLVYATEELMGAVEHYRTCAIQVLGRGCRQYDFSHPNDKDVAAEVKSQWKDGRFVYAHGPALVYGPASWSGLSSNELLIWQAIFGELTRNRRSSRSDRARVFAHPNCPLVPDGPNVVFAGNFRSSQQAGGQGYRIVGQTNRGWLRKAGLEIRDRQRPMAITNRPCVREFFLALTGLESKFHLTAVGRLGDEWLSSEAMAKLARSRSRAEWTGLMNLRLRVYAPEEYLERIRAYFQKQGGFADAENKPALAIRINSSPYKKKEIAEAAKISSSALSEFLAGRRSWPVRVRDAIESYLERDI
ncbi:hypothetical protein GYB59_16945 [bacterium]|nr:hypothetical protein [bacterium]